MQNERDRTQERPERPVERPERPSPPRVEPSTPSKHIDHGERDTGVVSPDNWVNPWDKESDSGGDE